MSAAPKIVPKNPEPEAPSAPKKGKGKLIAVIAGVLLIASAAGGWFYYQQQKAHAAPKVEVSKPPVFLPLDVFVVNLQSESGDQFLQVAMTLQVGEEKEMENLKTYMPLIRSRVISFLSAQKPNEILSVNGKAKLAADLCEAIKQPFAKNVPAAKVDGVFFTSFVVQ